MKLWFFLALFFLILRYPELSARYAAMGLHSWFECMVPALLPFMILSGIMIRQNLTERFAKVLSPLLKPVYRLNDNCVYGILLGFLCGFPMGARTASDLYERKRISKREASLLLAFCNNIGPVYFLNFLLPTIGMRRPLQILLCLCGMYGIPLLYGIFLRYSGFLLPEDTDHIRERSPSTAPAEPFLQSLDEAMQSGIAGITTLGGYMVLFNLLNLVPHTLLPLMGAGENLTLFASCLLEITGGVTRCGAGLPFPVLVLMPIGGLSCVAQTASMVRNTDLSVKNYVIHKLIQTALSFGYYFLLRSFLF